MNHGYADVSYQTTAELAHRQEVSNQLRRVQIIGLPKEMKQIDFYADVFTDNQNQFDLFRKVENFIDNFPQEKGIYIYGDFGVGKSFIMAAMANELSKKAFPPLYYTIQPLFLTLILTMRNIGSTKLKS